LGHHPALLILVYKLWTICARAVSEKLICTHEYWCIRN
jgi:hypothetical protein